MDRALPASTRCISPCLPQLSLAPRRARRPSPPRPRWAQALSGIDAIPSLPPAEAPAGAAAGGHASTLDALAAARRRQRVQVGRGQAGALCFWRRLSLLSCC
jgi:hypothetical protein